ncbi:EAL domain-containing protein [Psychromonas sp. KJ10-10]|uniref:EAL domain-containing protein n=1 Tax=Psychromonas sp. KJ10-10 TaxID=3391823 RepID=UPI0039B4924F
MLLFFPGILWLTQYPKISLQYNYAGITNFNLQVTMLALEKGYYRDEGIEVNLRSGDPNHQPVEEVLSGRALYATGNSEVLYQRLQGKPLIALAAIFQHSPSVLITKQESGIRTVHDLIGKKVMLANRYEDADFLTMLLNEGISLSQLDIVPSSYQLSDLISGQVDAFNSYTTNEPYLLEQNNIAFNVIDPSTYRIDFYSDIFFTSEREFKLNPQRVEAMRRATLKGWRYAMDNPQEIIDLLKSKYHITKTQEHLRFEAQAMRKLIIPNLIQIGHMNPERWKHMADTFIRSGLIKDTRYLDGFMYDTKPPEIPAWVHPFLATTILLVMLTTSIVFYLHRFNRRLSLTQTTLLESEGRFKALSEATYGGIVIHNKGIILECNSGLSDMSGYSYAELIGMNGLELIAPEDTELTKQNMHSASTESYEVSGISKDGTKYPIAIKSKNILYKGHNARVMEIRDISVRKKTEEQLKLAASVFTHAREGIVIADMQGNIVDVNETFSHITGYSREEVLGTNPSILSQGRHSVEFLDDIWTSLRETHEWSGEIWEKRKNGEKFATLATISTVYDAKENIKNYVALFSDITHMMRHQQQLKHIAHYDTLTNLPNRMLLSERLKNAIHQSNRRQQSIAVVYLDLDGFKAVNDNYGHGIGDELLIKLASLMKKSLRASDTIARIGGDEFVAVLVDIENQKDYELALERLLQATMSRVSIGNRSMQVSTSIGVTIYPHDNVDADQLIRHADQAMYIAKQTGKNRFHLFDVNQDKSIQSQHETIEHIKQALEQNQFVLYHQPKINMKTGKGIGTEALIRWQHPERGLLSPADFLPMITNQPISIELGDWVINNALDQIAKWQLAGLDIDVSINIDAYQLQQNNFVEKLSEALSKRTMINPSLLQLEILETSALGDMEEVLPIMQSCIDIGVSFAIDDFGTGFSSLTYLKRLTVDMLKIDQSFVRDMLEDPDDRAIVMGVIGLASAFNHQVIAEGVETAEHGMQLLSLGCVLAQGYGIARPMPAEDIEPWVKQWKINPTWLA